MAMARWVRIDLKASWLGRLLAWRRHDEVYIALDQVRL
jgi:hypothetical protein